MAVRPQDLVFYAGGECLRDYGVLVKRTSPGEEIVETYTRTGTPQNPDPAGKLIKAAANVPVVSWWDDDGDGIHETPRLQLEAGLTNLMTEADLDAWTKANTPIVTAIPGPDGNATSAFTVEDNDGAAQEIIYEVVGFTGDAVKAYKIAVKENTMPGGGVQAVGIYDLTGTAWIARMNIDSWAAGDPQITENIGILLDKWQIGATGWWVLEMQTVSVTAANTNQWRIIPAATGAETGKIDVFKPAAYDSAVPPTSILDASGVLGASQFSYPHPFPPQKAYFYAKFRERGTIEVSSARVLHLGASGNTDPRLFIGEDGAGKYYVVHDTGASQVVSHAPSAASIGETVELLAHLSATGTVQLTQSLDAAASEVGTESGALALEEAWSDLLIWLNSVGASAAGFAAFDAVKIVLDPEGRDYTLDELQDAA